MKSLKFQKFHYLAIQFEERHFVSEYRKKCKCKSLINTNVTLRIDESTNISDKARLIGL